MVETQTQIFRASLGAKVYRDFEVLSAKNLYDLAGAIVRVFGFDFDHAFGFYSKLSGHIFDSPVLRAPRTRIIDAFPVIGTKMTFLFDYGDNWQFQTEHIGQSRKEPRVRYPRLLKATGEAPEQYPDPDNE